MSASFLQAACSMGSNMYYCGSYIYIYIWWRISTFLSSSSVWTTKCNKRVCVCIFLFATHKIKTFELPYSYNISLHELILLLYILSLLFVLLSLVAYSLFVTEARAPARARQKKKTETVGRCRNQLLYAKGANSIQFHLFPVSVYLFGVVFFSLLATNLCALW